MHYAVASYNARDAPDSLRTFVPSLQEEKQRRSIKRGGPTDMELSCEHPPWKLSEEKMFEGKREEAG